MLTFVDRINEYAGRIVAFLILGHVCVIVWGVVLRYVFDSPQIWVDEMGLFLFGGYVILGGGYTFLHGEHVNTDILYRRFSQRGKAILDLVTFPLFFSFCAILFWKGMKMAIGAVIIAEKSWSVWGPPVWPIKIAVPVGAFLILLQGVSKLIRDIAIIFHLSPGRGDHR